MCSSLFIRGFQDQLHNHLSKMLEKGFSALAGSVPFNFNILPFLTICLRFSQLNTNPACNCWKEILCIWNSVVIFLECFQLIHIKFNVISGTNAYIIESTILLVFQRQKYRLHITQLGGRNQSIVQDYQQQIKGEQVPF